ncbi:MAG: carboxypeptidase regulatory-like domain-containing protein [Ignavibacteriales bacterium]|nr:carboxypeptidase regulatory-like domain-containing protein [Ignavibacteriales bacterium]
MKTIFFFAITVFCSAALVAGDVTGKVSFEGKPGAPVRLRMDADKFCAMAHKEAVLSEELVVNKNGTLKNVLIYIKEGVGGKKFDIPKTPVVFDQKGCIYMPHVLGVMAGQELQVKNSDRTLHNVHALPKVNQGFNQGQPVPGMMKKNFQKPEAPFKVKCEVHSWMGAYIGVFSHPYFAVTGDDGSFTIKGLPAGEYTVEAWHEKYGTQTLKVKVDATGKATANFSYKAG